MSQNAFLAAIQRITSGGLPLNELIAATQQLTQSGELDLSRQLYQIWINANRDDPLAFVALFNCSTLMQQLGDETGAEAALRDALDINADFAAAHINLGSSLERRGDAKAAVEQWKAGLERLTAVTGDAINYKTTLLKQISRVFVDNQQQDHAEATMHQCLDVNPAQRDVAEQYAAVRLSQCKWPIAASAPRMTRAELVTKFHPLSGCAYADDPYFQLGLAADYVRTMTASAHTRYDRRDAAIESGRRLRVGYVSSDLRSHAVGYLMVQLFEAHDPNEIEVFAYYCGIPSDDAITQRVKAAVGHWVDIRNLSDDQAAERIAADGIDILVDVNGHTRDARLGLFARRPAPVIVNWLGYPGTMGSPFHHYIIADNFIIPPSMEGYYSERVLRLPCYQPNDRKRIVAEKGMTRAEAGLPEDAFVFCSFNAAHKVTRYSFERWLDILKATPDSVLWLLDYGKDTHKRLAVYAEERGVKGERLIPAPKIANALHLARYPLADLFLDTIPYGAHTTASDALWMGVPVLTLSGRCFASRVCGSLLSAAGLPDLICATPEAFVARAISLASVDRATLASYRRRLQDNRDTCTLFDIALLARELESLYRQMAHTHQAGATPQPNLIGLDAYMEIGAAYDHDSDEIGSRSDYEAYYRTELAARHRLWPRLADGRLWLGEKSREPPQETAARAA